jgi:hypothetical protein
MVSQASQQRANDLAGRAFSNGPGGEGESFNKETANQARNGNGFTEIHGGKSIHKDRSMLAELDPNPSMKAAAPMDAILNPPVAETANQREMESVSPSERRLESSLLDELRESLAEPFARCISAEHVHGKDDECKEEQNGDAEVWEYGSDNFRLHSTVFNGTVRTRAPLLVRPRTARQVSR